MARFFKTSGGLSLAHDGVHHLDVVLDAIRRILED
jgi:hypothetical protein